MKAKLSFALRLRLMIVALVVLATLAPSGSAQVRSGPPLPQQQQSGSTTSDVWTEQQQKELAKKANVQRQQDIKKDTEKLLELATELKQSVDKSSENTLSLDVIKKAEQIEKLAKTVKEKMKGP